MADKPKKLFAKHVVRKLFLEDWALKLTALVITLALWFVVTGLSTPTTRRMNVPLNLSVASNAQVTNAPQQELEIEITGDKRRIEQINRSELAATIDLSEAPMGDRLVALEPASVFVPLPQGVKLTQVAPSRIVVSLELVEERELEVRAETKGSPAAGYEIYDITVAPARIRVRGPASVVSTLDHIKTDKIDIAGKRTDLTVVQLPVTSPNPKAAVLNTVVDVVIRIGERRVERAFSMPVSGLAGKSVNFVLYGPRNVVARVKPDDLTVEMYLNDNGEEEPHVILPRGLENLVEIRKVVLK